MQDHKVVFITGATSGIGLCAAIKLKKLGYKVIASGRDKKKLLKLKKNYNIDFLELDISIISDIQKKIEKIKEKYNKIDYLINCAGVGLFGKFGDLEDKKIQECVNINFLGTMIVIKYVSEIMRNQKNGHIITIESLASDNGVKYGEVYSATKAGISMFNSVLEKELRSENVKITAIKPGLVNTKLIYSINKEQDPLYGMDSEDIVYAIVFAVTQSERCNVSEIKLRPFDLRGQTLFQDLLEKNIN